MDNKLLKQRISRFLSAGLYPVTCQSLSEGRSDIEVLKAVADGGSKIIQLRDKESSRLNLCRKAEVFRRITDEYGMLFIVNDFVDIALAVGADGVHLGQADMPVRLARSIAPKLIIGVSTHTDEDVKQAQLDGASYYNIGPIFETQTKDTVGRFLGPESIPHLSIHSRLPFSVMGGIKEKHFPELIAKGARMIAVVTAVTQAANITEKVKRLMGYFSVVLKEPFRSGE